MWRVDPITKNSQRDHRISRRSTSQCNRCMCIETSISDVLLTVKKISRGWDIETCCTVKLPKRIVPINHREHRHGKVSLGLTSHVFYKVEPLFILFRVTLILIHRWLSCFEMGSKVKNIRTLTFHKFLLNPRLSILSWVENGLQWMSWPSRAWCSRVIHMVLVTGKFGQCLNIA